MHIFLNIIVRLVLCSLQQSQAQTGWLLFNISFLEDLKARVSGFWDWATLLEYEEVGGCKAPKGDVEGG